MFEQGPDEEEEDPVPSDCDERLFLTNHPHSDEADAPEAAGSGGEEDMDHALQATELQPFAKVCL